MLAAIVGVVALAGVAAAGCSSDDETADSGGDWCSLRAAIIEQDAVLTMADPGDPASLEEAVSSTRDFYDAARRQAPVEISDDVAVLVGAFDEFYDRLAAVDFDIVEAGLEVFEVFGDDVAAAGDRIDQYGVEVCGFGAVDDPSSTPPVLSDEDLAELDELLRDEDFLARVRADLIAQFTAEGYTTTEAECLADVFDVEAFLRLETERALTDEVRAAIVDCGVDPGELALDDMARGDSSMESSPDSSTESSP